MRDLILMVHLNNKYDKEKNEISWLKKNLGYSTGGLYGALDESGYFARTPKEIRLTEKGANYLNKYILPQYTVFHPLGYFLVILGFVFLFQWYVWTYAQTITIVPWYSGIMMIVTGIAVRFFFLRLVHLVMKRKSV